MNNYLERLDRIEIYFQSLCPMTKTAFKNADKLPICPILMGFEACKIARYLQEIIDQKNEDDLTSNGH